MGSDDFPFGIMDVVELLQLRVRRRLPDNVYTDCPICGDRRGKMNVNFAKNIWRCNYCGEYGGMLALYAKVYGTSTSDAYREICDALQVGDYDSGYAPIRCGNAILFKGGPPEIPEGIPQSPRASRQQIHQTYSVMLNMLTLLPIHKEHLMEKDKQLSVLADMCDELPVIVSFQRDQQSVTVTIPPPWDAVSEMKALDLQETIKEWSKQ